MSSEQAASTDHNALNYDRKRVTVWDRQGVERRNLRPVDAQEIVKAGGSYKPPKEKKR